MALKLMYITKDPAVAAIAEKNGVDRIFIDMECSGITPVSEGVFIPTGGVSNLTEEAFKRELQEFLDKWFKLVEGGGASQESL